MNLGVTGKGGPQNKTEGNSDDARSLGYEFHMGLRPTHRHEN
jgi:hypothetical protein